MYKYDAAVVIGRFNLPHLGHFYLIEQAAKLAKNVIVVIGSANNPKTPKNPFSCRERALLLSSGLTDKELSERVHITSVEDEIYNDTVWASKVQFAVEEALPSEVPLNICLVGFGKDESSFYLDMFPQWNLEKIPEAFQVEDKVLSSTDLRSVLFSTDFETGFVPYASSRTAPGVIKHIQTFFIKEPWFDQLKKEKEFLDNYRKQFENYPYPPTFVTTDAVVFQSGHVLMVTRKAEPGKGLLALPGGFISQNESLKQSMLRELVEETRIKVPFKILEKSIRGMKEFDHPGRSQRGRTITFAYHIQLEDVGWLPKVKGSDDAEVAKWYPISHILRNRPMIYEDHLDIIRHFLGYL